MTAFPPRAYDFLHVWQVSNSQISPPQQNEVRKQNEDKSHTNQQ